MKTLLFLIVIIAVFAALIWKMRKSQAEEALARKKESERRRQQQKEALTSDTDILWPVIIRPVKGEGSDEADSQGEAASMTTIEYEPPEQAAS